MALSPSPIVATDVIVTGAVLDDATQILVALPTERPGVHVPDPLELCALAGSATGALSCTQVRISDDEVLFGPHPEVMKAGAGGGTGGLQTSTLAMGLASASIETLRDEGVRRPNLAPIAAAFDLRWRSAVETLMRLATSLDASQTETLRREANDLVLQSTQAALAAIKGTGFVAGHPVGRRAMEALFFLVWSCPQGVLQAHLCDWASSDTIA